MTIILLCCLASYIIGSLPFGLWIGLWWKGVDIRTLGSKNIGSTNVLRVLGPGPAALVFIFDTLKGAFGAELAKFIWPRSAYYHPSISHLAFYYLVLIGICAILGHTFSIFLRFKGGKGVATSLGVLIALNTPVALVALLSWGVVLAVTRYVSIASLVATYSIPFASMLVLNSDPSQTLARHWMVALGTILAILVTLKHRTNIHRLLDGTEPKIGTRVPASADGASDTVGVM